MRLYRSIEDPYGLARCSADRLFATDFSDCPYTALQYATGRRGVVLVVDVSEVAARVSEELWLETKAKRFMFWGRLDAFIIANIPAKELPLGARQRVPLPSVMSGAWCALQRHG